MSIKSSKNISVKKIDRDLVLKELDRISQRIAIESRGGDADYAKLQLSWNHDILDRALNYLPQESREVLGIGAFMGTLEMALAPYCKEVVCVDFKSFLPSWKPPNIKFHKANIDSGEWKLPTAKGQRYDGIFLIETIEHLLWSPVPLLKWMHANCHMAVISTPDNEEWPAMEIHPWSRYQNFREIPSASPGAKSNPLPMFHSKQYNQAEFLDLLDFSGFRVNEFFRTGEGHHQMVAIVQPR